MILFLEDLARQLPATKTRAFLVLNNVSYHRGKEVCAWLAKHPRYEAVFTPVHGSRVNQVEPWFGRLQRDRPKVSDFSSLTDMAGRIRRYIEPYNRRAQPSAWSKKSFDKVLREAPATTPLMPAQPAAVLAQAA